MTNTMLSKEQATFARWVKAYPTIAQLWDFDQRAYDPDLADRFLTIASQHDAILARFFLCVWRRDNHYNFDVIEAALVLNGSDMSVITSWMQSPFWP